MKQKFSLIDIIIVLFLLIVISFGFIKLKGTVGGSERTTVHFTVVSAKTDKDVSRIINVGDEVTISLKEKAYAKVVKAYEKPHFEAKFNPNFKKYVNQEIEGISDLYIDLECDATVTDTEILDDGVNIRVGNEANVRGKGYAFEGYIVSVDDDIK